MNFKNYINTGFVSCRLIAETYDNIRKRQVRLYMIPGHPEDVGVTDGVDAWVCPISCNPFRVDVVKLFAAIHAGQTVGIQRDPPGGGRSRRTLLSQDSQDPEQIPTNAPTRRTRVVLQT